MRCDLLTHGECACPASTCGQQPFATAPVTIFTWRQHAIVVGFGFVVAAFVFLAIAPTEQSLRERAVINQESIPHG